MVYPALLPLMRTPRLAVVDWTDVPRWLKGTRPFRRKTKSGFCARAITFQTQSTDRCITYAAVYVDSFWEAVGNYFVREDEKVKPTWYSANLFVALRTEFLYCSFCSICHSIFWLHVTLTENHLSWCRIMSFLYVRTFLWHEKVPSSYAVNRLVRVPINIRNFVLWFCIEQVHIISVRAQNHKIYIGVQIQSFLTDDTVQNLLRRNSRIRVFKTSAAFH